MGEVTPKEHAARLRLLRRIGGMMHHPESHKVLTEDEWGRLADAAYIIRRSTPMTADEFLDFCAAGVRDLNVVWSDEKARWVFDVAV